MKRSDSMTLFDIMDKVGVSEEIRRLHQEKARHYEILEQMCDDEFGKCYALGSSSEGTKTPGYESDLDLVYCHDCTPLVLNLKDAPKQGDAALLTEIPETAGYVKLQVIHDGLIARGCHVLSQEYTKMGWIKEDGCGDFCWTNLLIPYQHFPDKGSFHGPARTYVTNTHEPLDFVFAFHCRKWPLFANEWFSRKRDNDWPDNKVIAECRKLGFLVVQVCHPHSKERDIEWRISFSFQERLLMFSLNEVQHKCYVLLKIIKRDLIEGAIAQKSITSYHCKTSILYASEQNPQIIWCPENLFQCVITCLKLLLDWARKGHCPNYFIPEENMFDGIVTGQIKLRVINVLEQLLTEGDFFLKRIKTDNIGKYVLNISSGNEIEVLENMTKQDTQYMKFILLIKHIRHVLGRVANILHEKCMINQRTLQAVSKHAVVHVVESLKQILDRHSKIECIGEYTIAESRDVKDFFLPFLHSSLACHLLSFALQCEDNVQRDQYLCLSEDEYREGIFSDVASSRLKYITHLYKLGKYDLCEQELVSLEQQINEPSTISLSPFRDAPIDVNCDFGKELKRHNYDTKYLLQHNVCASVVFLPTELEIIPHALQFEMFRSTGQLPESRHETADVWYDSAVVESKVYMYFLMYLLTQKIKVSPEELNIIISKLANAACESQLHVETSFNLLSWVLKSENRILQAIQISNVSWRVLRLLDLKSNPMVSTERMYQHNAAKWHMLILINQVWFSKRSSENVQEYRQFCFRCFKQSPYEMQKCSTCKIAQYCCRDCQQRDWKIHRKICKNIK